jgi:hypothetical protein
MGIHTPGLAAESSPELRMPLNTAHQPARNQGYARTAEQDDDDDDGLQSNEGDGTHSDHSEMEMSANITRPNEFQLASRRTRDFEDTEY